MSKQYEKYVISEPVVVPGEFITYHKTGTGPYLEYLNKTLVPDSKAYCSLWKITKVPAGNPPSSIHAHKVDQFVMYIGEPYTFEIVYNLIPPEAELKNEWWTTEHQYKIEKTTGIYIPAGLRHNNWIHKIDKPPVYEVTFMLQPEYDQK